MRRNRRIVLYLGAGCSKSVHVPEMPGYPPYEGKSWKGLLQALLDTFGPEVREKFLQNLRRRAANGQASRPVSNIDDVLRDFNMLQVAWFLTSLYRDRDERDAAIKGVVEPSGGAERKSPLHDQLLSLEFDDIVTTNYDSHIEYFLKEPITVITCSGDLSSRFQGKKEKRLFYLHGKAGHSRLVFDRFDYARLLSERDGILDYVTFLLRDAHAIYVGFGLDDPTFNLMETRLQTLQDTKRPESFAFVRTVTETERRVWRERKLAFVDYGDDQDLPKLLECVNKIRDFISWAEPQRPDDVHSNLNADRTAGYLNEALSRYVQGDFVSSLNSSRAALASTLFWEREPSSQPNGTPLLPFDRVAKVCDIRIRMALNHYKLHLIPGMEEDPVKPLQENIDVAKEIIKTERDLNRGRKIIVDALHNSLKILEARKDYHEGHLIRAREAYADVASEETASAMQMSEDQPEDVIWKLKLQEGYYYAKCQMSRIDYQLQGPELVKERENLADVITQIKNTSSLIQTHTAWSSPAELDYYRNSIAAILRIAKWTQGRHAVRIFKDVIPTQEERTEENKKKLSFAIELLRTDPVKDQQDFWKASPRWLAMKSRYLSRGYALRWVVTETGEPDDIIQAQTELRQISGPGLERQHILNLFELARLHILVMFGECVRRNPVVSPLSFGACLQHLDEAFLKTAPPTACKQIRWLPILGYRLASYFALVANAGWPNWPSAAARLQAKELGEFLRKNPEDMLKGVVREYEEFALHLGNSNALDNRIQNYKEGWESIRRELEPVARPATA